MATGLGWGWFNGDWQKITATSGKFSKQGQQNRGQWSANKNPADLQHANDYDKAILKYGAQDETTEQFDDLFNLLFGSAQDFAQPFPGQLSAPTPEGANVGSQRALEALRSPNFGRTLRGEPAFQSSPEISDQFFRDAISKPAFKRLNEEILPLIGQANAGLGSFWGSQRVNAQNAAIEDLQEALLGEQSRLRLDDLRNFQGEQSRAADRQLQVPGALGEFTRIASLPATYKQLGLDREYADWVRRKSGNPAAMNAVAILEQEREYQKFITDKATALYQQEIDADVRNDQQNQFWVQSGINLIGALMGGGGGSSGSQQSFTGTPVQQPTSTLQFGTPYGDPLGTTYRNPISPNPAQTRVNLPIGQSTDPNTARLLNLF